MLLVAILLPWLAGCGLGGPNGYERKFADESERIKKFDEADQALGNPIFYPMNVGTKQQPMFMKNDNIFLRLPAGIPGKNDTDLAIQGFLYRYSKDQRQPTKGDTFPPPNEKEQGI